MKGTPMVPPPPGAFATVAAGAVIGASAVGAAAAYRNV